jgi:hypothetical protein
VIATAVFVSDEVFIENRFTVEFDGFAVIRWDFALGISFGTLLRSSKSHSAKTWQNVKTLTSAGSDSSRTCYVRYFFIASVLCELVLEGAFLFLEHVNRDCLSQNDFSDGSAHDSRPAMDEGFLN